MERSENNAAAQPVKEKLGFDDDALFLKALAETYKDKGDNNYIRRNFSDAIFFYTEGIKVNCKDDELNAKLYTSRATAYFYSGSYHESLNDAKAANELQPTYIEAFEIGARACLELQLFEEAIIWCANGLEIDNKNKILSEIMAKSDDKSNRDKMKTTPRSVDVPESDSSLHKTANEAGQGNVNERQYTNIDNAHETLENSNNNMDSKEVRDRIAEGGAYCLLGKTYLKIGNFKKAIDCYERYLKIAKEVENKAAEGCAYACLGNIHVKLGDLKKAIDYHEICLKIYKETGDRAREGATYGNLGTAYHSLGDFKKAIDYHGRHLQIAKEVQDRAAEGIAYVNLGNDYRSLGDLQAAVSYYEFSLKIANEVGDKDGQGIAYNNLGIIYRIFGDVKKAIDFHERHLEMANDMGDRAGEGIAYGNLGIAYRALGKVKQAVDYHELQLKIAKEMGDRESERSAYANLGNDHPSLGDFRKSIDYHELNLKLAKEVGNRAEEGSAYGYIGNAHLRLGNTKKAIQYHELHLKFAKELGQRSIEGTAYCSLGIAYHILGDLKKAIVYHERHLKIAEKVRDRAGEGNAYGNIGGIYHSFGDLKKAIYCYELHLKIAKEVGNRATEGIAYGELGSAYQSLGNFKRAINYHELQLKIAQEVGDRAGEGGAYGKLANDHLSLGNFKKSIDYLELQLTIAKELGNIVGEGFACGILGSAYRRLGDFKKAISYNKLHLKVAKEVGDKTGEGGAYSCIGNAYFGLGDIENAVHYHELHAKIAKEVRDRTGEGTAYGNLGIAYRILGDFEKAKDYHELHLKLAKEVGDRVGEGRANGNLGNTFHLLGDLKKAKEFNEVHLKIAKEVGDKAEEAKAYFLMGCTFESLHSVPEAVDCYQSSIKILNDVTFRVQFKDEWKINLRNMNQNAYTSLWRLLLEQDKVLEALSTAEQGRAQALKDLMQIKYGFGAACVGPQKPDETIYGILCCASSSIVFSAIGEQEIFFWVSQKGKDVELRRNEIRDKRWWGDVASFFQPLIQKAFKEMGVRAGVRCEDRSLDNLRDETLANERPVQKTTSASLQLQQTSLRTLYDLIIEPVADLIHGNEVILVPEGPLCLLPHAAFMDSNSKYLSESFRLRVIPSLTSLKLLADCAPDYHCKTGALLVGDPWVQEYTYQDRKLRQLPCAREEVEMIGRILNTAPLTGTDATKDAVLQRLSSVALVHIAAHGRMDTGEIALAPNPTQASEILTEKDFLLTMADVLSVKIRARLVVLSCCHSGRGEIKAEGVVGIARAFMGAGARSVLVSLWAIDDVATLEFMKSFYQHLVEGRSASEALNQAMKFMRV